MINDPPLCWDLGACGDEVSCSGSAATSESTLDIELAKVI